MKKYIISENQLLDLLKARHYCRLSDRMDIMYMRGVDISATEIENAYIAEHLGCSTEEVETKQLTIKDCAGSDLQMYQFYKEN